MLQNYLKPTLYIHVLLLIFSATNPLASSEFLANSHGCGDLKAGGGAGCRGRDGQGRRDGWRGRAWQIDTERTGTVRLLTYPDTVRIVRASHFLLKSTSCTDQLGGEYNSDSMVARDLWPCKPPLSSGFALRLGCHKSLSLVL